MKKLLLLLLLPFTLLAQKEAVLHLTTDAFPSETYWYVISGSSNNLGDTIDSVPAGYYTQANTTYSDTMYIADSITNITLLLRDTYGDGMTSGSYYYQVCEDTIINYPVPNPNIGYGLFHNRTVPQCMPQPPPPSGPCNTALIQINLDQYPSETSWDIKDTSGSVLFSGGPYFGIPNYQPQEYFKCLPLGELTFTIYDSYGDGVAGSLWGGQDGSYYVMQCGDTLVYGDVPNFGTDTSHVFQSDTCVPPPPILGCMDSDYLEYDHSATQDDSSCVTLKIIGCIDSTMFNYDSLANYMDYVDSCDYTLILHDLVGNGWVGSHLEIYQEDTTSYVLTSGFNQNFTLQLKAPCPVSAKFFIVSQAINTLVECGFTLLNPFGDTVMSVLPPFMQPFFTYSGNTYCGNECIEIVEGCMDSLAFNYVDTANTIDDCFYYPGCTSPAYLSYHLDTAGGYFADINIQDSCLAGGLAIFGCTDFLAFNYNPVANVDNGGCVPIVTGCMQPLAFNYNPNANVSDTCIAIVYGCMSQLAINYDSLANTDDGSCIGIVLGCTDTLAFNWNPNANVDDSSCVAVILGCINPTMFNYCDTCNTNDGSCIEILYGCTDSTMFNYNPLANVDNNSCVSFIYGCTDPSMLNYNPSANTEDFSCIAYIYGCTDSTALNYDSLANTENGSCIEIIQGCIDPNAWNYNPEANMNFGHDSLGCLYAADCEATEPGEPYFLNDACYAWVIEIDEYCCNNTWDEICQLTYNYCEGTYTGPLVQRVTNKELISITDILGRSAKESDHQILFYRYNDGTVKKIIRQ